MLILWTILGLHGAAEEQPAPRRAEGKVDLNRATADELIRLPGIGRTRAEMIVRVREANGPFRCVEELLALPRLTQRVFDGIQGRLEVSGPESRRDCAQGVSTEPRNEGGKAQVSP